MTDRRTQPNPGNANRSQDARGRMVAADWIALVLSALWLFAAGAFFLILSPPAAPETEFQPSRFLMTLLAVFMPVALIWVGAAAAKSAKMMREESSRLQAAIDAMRQAYVDQAPQGASGTRLPLEQKLDEIARAQKKTEAALAHLTSVNARAMAAGRLQDRAALTAPKAAEQTTENSQPALALGTPAEAMAEPISASDFVQALNFPENEHDQEGFRALRLALKDPSVSKLVRSAQDILTLLAEDGIYMDDLAPDRARPEVWRRFAEGERGRTVAGLGGIRDRASLALTAGRMRQDPVFRDCAHHFLRLFDTAFAAFEKNASDAEIAAFADTRSARAFMLIGRVSGTFD